MPAEWEPHSGTWLSWPHNGETWPASVLPEVEKTYLAMIRALASGEIVHVLVNDEPSRQKVEKHLHASNIPAKGVKLHIIPNNDAWIRDYGPNFLVRENSGERDIGLNKWGFDSWGGKYDWKLDNEAGNIIARTLKVSAFEPGIVLEGGAIEPNGKGTCLTTEQCLLNKNRNGGLSREVMETYLKNYLGVTKIVWLKGGIRGDDTDGHIDNLARFVNPTTILCAYEDDPSDPNHKELKGNYDSLLSATDQDGNPFTVLKLPMPGVVKPFSTRLPASYANFYIGNRAVLLPVYGHPNDEKAKALLQKFFPDREIIAIACNHLVVGLGSIHCVTQQQPS